MKKILTFFLLIILSIVTMAFEMTPEYFGHRIDGDGGFQEYTLKNSSNKTIRYRFSALPSKKAEKSMDKWVIFQPKFMTIKPGDSRKLKVFAKAPEGTPEGDYAFYMFVQSVNIPDIVTGDKKENTISAGTSVGINVAIQMLGWVGDLPAKVKLKDYSIYEKNGELHMKGVVKNETPKRFARYRVLVHGQNRSYEPVFGGVLISGQEDKFDTALSDKFKSKKDIEKIEILEIPSQEVLQTINF